MAENEQTDITIKRGKSPIIRPSRQKVYEIRSRIQDIAEREQGKQIANYTAYGNGKYIQEGSKDRLLGRTPNLPQKAKSESDIFSYYGGYYDKGSRNLVIYASGTIPSFISKSELLIATGYNEPENEEIKTQEVINKILAQIGYLDAQDPKIIYENLPLEVRNNIYYTSGYNMALETKNSKKR